MKRRRSRRWATGTAVAIAQLWLSPAMAQGGVGGEGGIFLLRPVGARAVGMGQAVVARSDGSEGLWWNPAALAGATRREMSIHHSQDFFATGDALTLVVPSPLLGVVSLSADLQNYGEQENTTDPGTPSTGTILSRSFVLSAAYATAIGGRTRTGVAFKVVQLRVDCTGPCDFPNEVAQTFAIDAGVQHELGASRRFVVGVGLRNMGLPLQVEDSPQADPLPSRVQVGMLYRYPVSARYAQDLEINLSADVIDGLRISRPLPRLGAEIAWQKRAFVRGGYVFESSGSESGGPALGLGLISNNLIVDLARVFSGFSVDAGQAPTYLSIRLAF